MSTTTRIKESKTVMKRRRSIWLKRLRERHRHLITTDKGTCPICQREFTDEESLNLPDCIGCSECGRCFHSECSGIQKGWVGYRAVNCGHYDLQCCAAKSEVGKITPGHSTHTADSVPHTIEERNTLLQRQWLKRKRIRRILDVDDKKIIEK